MKNLRSVLGVLMLAVMVFGVIGCNAMPVTMTPFASYGGNGIDYPNRNDQNHQWQVGMAASFVLGGNGAVANAVSTPALPSTVRVNNGSSSSATNSNSNSNSNSNTNSNNGFIPPGQQ